MSLLAPLMLLGGLALAIPVVAHLLGREPPVLVRFAGLRFLRHEEPRISRRRRIHDRALLLVRMAMLAAIVLVLARPVTTTTSTLRVLAEPHDAVILLDTSASMGLVVDEQTRLARAIESAEEIVDALPPGSRAAVLTSDPAGPHLALADTLATAAGTLEAWAVDDAIWRPGAWTLAEALPRATAMFAAGDGARPRAIYAIGDPTARGLGSLPAALAGGIHVIPVVARGRASEVDPPPPEHLGIADASWEPAPEIDPSAVRVRAVVARHGGVRADEAEANEREVTVALEIAGSEVARTRVSVAANSRAEVEFTPTLALPGQETPPAEDAAAATVALVDDDDDPLPIDDRRHLWLVAEDSLTVMVINGDPSEQRANDEVYFLTTALASTRGPHLTVTGVAPDQLELRLREHGPAALAAVDVLILANVRAPSAEAAAWIRERVEQGMGLVLTVGDRVVAADYNQRFATLLPLLMRDATFAGTAPGRLDARSEGIAPIQLAHPMFAGLATDLDLGGTRTRRMMLLEPDPRRDATIAIAFTSGAPALITATVGEGRTALLTTSIDRAWGDLPLRPGFVALVDHLVAWTSGAHERAPQGQVGVGEERPLPPGAHYRVHTPDGRLVGVSAATGESPRFVATDRPGHYWIETRERGGVAGRVDRFVVEVDARESDTQPIAVAELAASADESEVEIQRPRWRELMWLVVLLLLVESGLRLARARRLR